MIRRRVSNIIKRFARDRDYVLLAILSFLALLHSQIKSE